MIHTILQIETSSDLLRTKARKLGLDEIKSKKIQSLIETMRETMRSAPGVGLAAPQIGIPIQLAVIEDPEERLKTLLPEVRQDRKRVAIEFHVLINPVIKKLSGKINYFFEGCLSVKDRVRVTPRYDIAEVEYQDENGGLKTITAQGWYARILQHEIDHLNGHLYIDIADERTEQVVNEMYKNKWFNAMQDEIKQYYSDTCCC